MTQSPMSSTRTTPDWNSPDSPANGTALAGDDLKACLNLTRDELTDARDRIHQLEKELAERSEEAEREKERADALEADCYALMRELTPYLLSEREALRTKETMGERK